MHLYHLSLVFREMAFVRYLIAIVLLSAHLFAEISPSQEELNAELIAEGGQVLKIAPSPPLEQKDPIMTNVHLYAALGGGLYLNNWPNLGTSIRMQGGVHGVELEFCSLYHLDFVSYFGYKAALSYLYHFRKKGSGMYIGGGPGCVFDRHILCPLAITWVGYQFLSQFPQRNHLSGFVDGGITLSIFKDGSKAPATSHAWPAGPLLLLVPVLRAGVGVSF